MVRFAKESQLQFRGLVVTVTRKSIKNLHLRIKPPKGDLFVSAPYALSDREISAFLEAHAAWIESHRASCIGTTPRHDLAEGSTLMLFGSRVRLAFSDERSRAASFDGSTLSLPKGKGMRSALKQFYTERLSAYAEPILNEWSRKMDLVPSTLRYRIMTSRWGSCHVGKRVVTLNLRLAFYPISLIEYVIAHELAHFYHPNHSPAFYALLSRYMPDASHRKQKLRELERAGFALPDPFL